MVLGLSPGLTVHFSPYVTLTYIYNKRMIFALYCWWYLIKIHSKSCASLDWRLFVVVFFLLNYFTTYCHYIYLLNLLSFSIASLKGTIHSNAGMLCFLNIFSNKAISGIMVCLKSWLPSNMVIKLSSHPFFLVCQMSLYSFWTMRLSIDRPLCSTYIDL